MKTNYPLTTDEQVVAMRSALYYLDINIPNRAHTLLCDALRESPKQSTHFLSLMRAANWIDLQNPDEAKELLQDKLLEIQGHATVTNFSFGQLAPSSFVRARCTDFFNGAGGRFLN